MTFPAYPIPKDQKTFWRSVKLGGESKTNSFIRKPCYRKVYHKVFCHVVIISVDRNSTTKLKINLKAEYTLTLLSILTMYLLSHGSFYIGGYQPAQKWLKDRKTKHLSFDEVAHYQKIIVALDQTDKLMKEIDKMDFI